jgi:hypothetical protein
VREREEACALAFQKLVEEEMALKKREGASTAHERTWSEVRPDSSLSMAQIRRAVLFMSLPHLAKLVKDIVSNFYQRLQDGGYFINDGVASCITRTPGTSIPSTSTLAASTLTSNTVT